MPRALASSADRAVKTYSCTSPPFRREASGACRKVRQWSSRLRKDPRAGKLRTFVRYRDFREKKYVPVVVNDTNRHVSEPHQSVLLQNGQAFVDASQTEIHICDRPL